MLDTGRGWHHAPGMHPRAFTVETWRVRIQASSLPAPLLTYNTKRGTWTLEESYTAPDGSRTLRVAAPFEFDLATVPRPFWGLIAPFELSIVAPLVHDFLYLYAGDPPAGAVTPAHHYTRAEADRLFLRLMQAEGVAFWRRTLAYAAVRLFAGPTWGTPLGVRPTAQRSALQTS